MRIALINAGVVANIIEADMDFALMLGYDEVAEATDAAYIGGQYASGAFVPRPDVPAPTPEPVTVMTKLAFLRRFTQGERLAIRAAAVIDPVIEDSPHD